VLLACRQLGDNRSRPIEQIPVKGLVAGSVGEVSNGNVGDIDGRAIGGAGADAVRGEDAIAVEGQGSSLQDSGSGGEVGSGNRDLIAPGVVDGGGSGGAVCSSVVAPSKFIRATSARTGGGEIAGGTGGRCGDIDYATTRVRCGGGGIEGRARAITARRGSSGGVGIVAVDGVHQVGGGDGSGCANENVIRSSGRSGRGEGVSCTANGHSLGVGRVGGDGESAGGGLSGGGGRVEVRVRHRELVSGAEGIVDGGLWWNRSSHRPRWH
jgi:hypothetical protein